MNDASQVSHRLAPGTYTSPFFLIGLIARQD